MSIEAIHEGERVAVLTTIGEQAVEIDGHHIPSVTCPCGASGPLHLMFRCFFCEVFLCPNCAEDHFGPQEDQ